MNLSSIEILAGKLEHMSLIVLVLMLVEWGILIVTSYVEKNKEGVVSIVSYLIQSIPYFLLSKIFIVGTMFWLYENRIFTLGFQWYIWIVAYLLYDFTVFFIHFLGHKVRVLWCIHGVHHTAEEMNLTVVARGSIFDVFFTPFNFIWLPILGFHPLMIFVIEPIARLYATLTHVNEKVIGKQKWLDKLLITPSVHRVHHAKNHIYLDRNYGETFSIWDRLFKTFQKELDNEKIVYGIMHEKLNSENLWHVQFLLWKELWLDIKKAPTLLDKVKYLFMPPGWNHIDGGKKAKEYRDEAWKFRVKKNSLSTR
ncbi:sterol desaturase family protein [Tenacibaculum sp. XPcli2-G]|uniref:sterol desaturase family protein n=1 Tax=Tenacibaculum sp. XPcli2-G TaxID=2954503 RepID=UPI0020980075|nr:sterol desaturase family protein [Tenacibaculum sp. XPcli2-G]MCO7184338.1 sterol desaturase family protein [Tenacibaculum sp. XPcli2-G]